MDVTTWLTNAKNDRFQPNPVQVGDRRMGEILRFYGMSEDEVTTIIDEVKEFRSAAATDLIVKLGRSV